jgi:hypothetical protein
MLPNARRICFYEDYYRPAGIVFVQSKPKNLLNDKGQFIVQIDEKNPYVEELVKKAQALNLTVSGDGTAPVGRSGDVRNANNGDFLSFGTSSRFDMNWIKRAGYVCENGYRPTYTMSKDWKKINSALEQYADQKKSVRLSGGTNVQFHSRFCVIDGRVHAYDNNEIAVSIPVRVLQQLVVELGIINIRLQY